VGEKGARLTPAAAEAAKRLVDDLQPLGDVASRSMFGGFGIFVGGTMFALVDSRGEAFLRVDDESRPRFDAAGSERHAGMPYFSIPSAVRRSPEELQSWAGSALEIARQAKASKR
jgi:DNA transformation protein and related proteins